MRLWYFGGWEAQGVGRVEFLSNKWGTLRSRTAVKANSTGTRVDVTIYALVESRDGSQSLLGGSRRK